MSDLGAVAVDLGVPFAAGFVGMAVYRWLRPGTPGSAVERVHQNVALTILADEAVARLDDEERAEVEAEVTDKMVAAFGEGASVDLARLADEEGNDGP